MAADYFLQVENFSPEQVFENRLEAALSGAPAAATSQDGKLAGLARPFLDAVAAPHATPGGGSVSAFAGALAASLGQMVAGLSRKKKSQRRMSTSYRTRWKRCAAMRMRWPRRSIAMRLRMTR